MAIGNWELEIANSFFLFPSSLKLVLKEHRFMLKKLADLDELLADNITLVFGILCFLGGSVSLGSVLAFVA